MMQWIPSQGQADRLPLDPSWDQETGGCVEKEIHPPRMVVCPSRNATIRKHIRDATEVNRVVNLGDVKGHAEKHAASKRIQIRQSAAPDRCLSATVPTAYVASPRCPNAWIKNSAEKTSMPSPPKRRCAEAAKQQRHQRVMEQHSTARLTAKSCTHAMNHTESFIPGHRTSSVHAATRAAGAMLKI